MTCAMMSGVSLAATVKQRALEIGFDLAGIARPGVWKDLEFSRRWVERGYGGEMRYLANPKRFDPRRVLPSAKSVICVGLMYNTPFPYSTAVGGEEESRQEAAGRMQKPGVRSRKSEVTSLGTNVEPRGSPPISGGFSSFDSQVSVPHAKEKPEERTQQVAAEPRGWISRYAWGRDYHEVMRAKLEELRAAVEELSPGVETRVYVDTGPIVERVFARYSGIGWMGKNTCLINDAKGSWFFLGVILTSVELEPDLLAPDRCGSCTACLEACPTGALVMPYVMDASRCISYFTIELKGSVPEEFRARIGANVFGCDICQDVCPWNSQGRSQESEVRSQDNGSPPSALSSQPSASGHWQTKPRPHLNRPATTNIAEFQPLKVKLSSPSLSLDARGGGRASLDSEPGTSNSESPARDAYHLSLEFSLFNPPLEALASITEEDFRRLFAHSPIKRVKYRGWLRNLCVAMGNSGDRRFIPWLEHAAQHTDAIVREHAAWALDHLRKS